MSTRATYSFESGNIDTPVVFYVHCDNYPEGAANYFWIMYQGVCENFLSNHYQKPYKGGLAEVFMKSNGKHVEFTNPESVGCCDDEYHYLMKIDGTLEAFKAGKGIERSFKPFFKGHYAAFINKYGDKPIDDVLIPIDDSMLKVSAGAPKYLTLNDIGRYIVSVGGQISENCNICLKQEMLRWTLFFQKALENVIYTPEKEILVDNYYGSFDSELDFSKYYLNARYSDLSKELIAHIDYERFRESLFKEYFSVQHEGKCHVFQY